MKPLQAYVIFRSVPKSRARVVSKIGKSRMYVVDLHGCSSKEDVIRATAATFIGADSLLLKEGLGLSHGNRDALDDVLSDWFAAHWGDDKQIVLRGVRSVAHVDPVLPAMIVDAIHRGFQSAIADALENKRNDVADEIDRTRFDVDIR